MHSGSPFFESAVLSWFSFFFFYIVVEISLQELH